MSFIDIIKSNTTTTATLTAEDLVRTGEAIRRPPRPHYHLIAASAKPGTLTFCSDCGSPVRVPDTWGRR